MPFTALQAAATRADCNQVSTVPRELQQEQGKPHSAQACSLRASLGEPTPTVREQMHCTCDQAAAGLRCGVLRPAAAAATARLPSSASLDHCTNGIFDQIIPMLPLDRRVQATFCHHGGAPWASC